MGKRNRFRRQSIRELPLILGPLPLPDSRLFGDEGSGATDGSVSARDGLDDSLPIAQDESDEGVDERILAPVDSEPLRP